MSSVDKSKLMAILFDSTRCIGCRSCEEACDDENASRKRKWSADTEKNFRKPPEGLSCDKWVHMSFHKLSIPNGTKRKPFNWDDAWDLMEEKQYAFMRHACMHCVEPACESACIVGALVKQENGAVTYDPDKCMGCRYCMIACPFSIPKWEWHKPLPYIKKCTMCFPRQQDGKVPSCVENCPGNDDGPALTFGSRYDLIYQAKKRIHENKDRYYPHVFGEKEVGGTGVLYVINKNLTPAQVGFPQKMKSRSIPDYSQSPMSTVPYWVGGFGAMFAGLNWIIKRRDKIAGEEQHKQPGDEK
jgi:Fe-S-cluster-containing dehydrogenase component